MNIRQRNNFVLRPTRGRTQSRIFLTSIVGGSSVVSPIGVLAIFVLTVVAISSGMADEKTPVRVPPRPIKPSTVGVGRFFSELQAEALDGRIFDLKSAKNHKATVIALTSTSCPICKKYLPTLARIEKEYTDRGIQFCFLNTLPSDKPEDMQRAIKANQLKGPYVFDRTDKYNRLLDTLTTAEVFVFDSARTLVYRGAVDDQYGLGYSLGAPKRNYLTDALDALLANRRIEIAATTAPGCDIYQPNTEKRKSTNVTYHNRISRLVQNHCVECHREQGLAPFSLESADDLIAHAGMIRTVVKNETMPPWFAGDKSQVTWGNDRSLTDQEKMDLLGWLESGHEMGDPGDAPRKRVFTSEWNIGKPDAAFRLPRPFTIQATGTMPYKYTRVETRFKEDKWIRAVEIRPTDRSVVHHVLVFIRGRGRAGDVEGTDGFFAAYVPGNSYQIFPEGFAKKIPAGASLIFQIHYTPVGHKTTDQTEVGFKFYEGTPKHVLRVKGIANRRIRIPAGAENHPEHASLRVPTDVKLMAFMPHMHLRGKAFRYELVSQGQPSKILLDVPRYDFNWQIVYRLAEPMLVRKGTVIRTTAWYDNSENNPANPDPDHEVRWGDQTDEEMMLGYIEYYLPNEKIEPEKTASAKNEADEEIGGSIRDRARSEISRRIIRKAFERYDVDRDGKVTREELGRPRIFDSLNTNGDDHLTLEEALANRR